MILAAAEFGDTDEISIAVNQHLSDGIVAVLASMLAAEFIDDRFLPLSAVVAELVGNTAEQRAPRGGRAKEMAGGVHYHASLGVGAIAGADLGWAKLMQQLVAAGHGNFIRYAQIA